MSIRYVPSLETAQHSPKGLRGACEFGKKIGCHGLVLSNFLVTNPYGRVRNAKEVKAVTDEFGLDIHAISAHCPFYVHGAAWTGTPGIRPFVPDALHGETAGAIEHAMENLILSLIDLCQELGLPALPMFWGSYYGLELASG